MSVPIPFGQYVPIDSPVHRLEARTKMLMVAAYTVALFSVDGLVGLVVLGAVSSVAVRVTRIPLRLVLRGLRPILFLLVFTLMAHSLRLDSATVALVRIGRVSIDAQGLATGLYFATRIVLLVIGTSLLTLTTAPVQLTEGLERLMRPLARLRVPTGDLAMMLTVALRFIPTTAEEAEKIIVAQTARGARFSEGGPIRRARAYVPILVPLFVGLFRRADNLATAMESRCYRGAEGRTRLNESRMRATDWYVLVISGGSMIALAIVL